MKCVKVTADGPQFIAPIPLISSHIVLHGGRQRGAYRYSKSLKDGIHEF